MTSETTTQAEPSENETDALRDLIERARVVLWDFDGPICRLFAGHTAESVAAGMVDRLAELGLADLLTDAERDTLDPQVVLTAVGGARPGGELVAELEELLTEEELRATASAMPTAYADPLIRTWTAVGARLAVTTNNSPLVVHAYLAGRGLAGCFGPHVYGRSRDLHLLKPDPDCLDRALAALGADPADALMIGDSPTDWFAARTAGVPFLGYARSERKAKLLREAGAGQVVPSLEPVLNLVRALPWAAARERG
ncbi:HAD family hydrolase [Streptomyces sp. NPDC005435]|uniref:HAD family hydrolase n=1 Tax=Streptomyces sp. NPDC005435 TaxID=3154464 RepID=UPI00345398D2